MRLLQINCFITFLFLVGNTLHAQRVQVIDTRFYCNGHEETFNRITDVLQTKDKGFAFVGSTPDSGGGIMPMCTSFGTHAVMGKLDSLGNLVWIKNQCSVASYSTTICQTPDGGFAVNGGIYTDPTLSIFRYDSAGNFLWRKDYGKDAKCGTTQIISTADHGFLLLGHSSGQDSDIPYNYKWPPIAFQPVDWVLMKLDSLGNKQWVRVLGTSEDEKNAVVVTDGKYYYLIGSTQSKDHDCADTINHPGSSIYTIKLDSAGNVLWSKAHGWGFPHDAIFDDRDSSILVTGRVMGNGHEFTGAHGLDDIFLMKLDTDGNYKWGKLYGTATDDRGYGICKGPSNTYLLAGEAYDNSTSTGRGILLNIDSGGNTLDQRIITGGPGGISWRGVFPFKSSFAAVGISYAYQLNEGTGHNCPFGTMGSGALVLSTLQLWKASVPLTHSTISEFSVSPNPAHNSFDISFNKPHSAGQLYSINSLGQTVFRSSIEANADHLTINTGDWPRGNYVICWRAKGKNAPRCTAITIH